MRIECWRDWFKPKAGALNTLLAPHYFASDKLVLTKRGDLFAVYKLPGIDFECKTEEELESITQRLHTAIRNLNPAFRIYRYAIKTKGVDLAYHRAKELYSFSFYLGLLHEVKPNTAGFLTVKQSELNARIEDVENHLSSFESATRSLLCLDRLNYEQIPQFLGKLTKSEVRLSYSDHIDYWAARTPILVTETGLYIDAPVRTLTLRQLPRTTKPNLFSELLRLPCDLILCDEFKRIQNDKAIALAESFEDHFFYKKNNRNAKDAARDARKTKEEKKDKVEDTVAIENLSEVGQIKVRIANKGEFLGEYSLTLILSGDNLGRASAEAINIVGNTEGELAADGTGSLDAYLSVIPGNTTRNLRRQWNLSMNYADMAPVYGPPIGDAINRHLGREALCILETSFCTPYYFNLHESDLLGALEFGQMGMGKSFDACKFIHESQKYKPYTFILDVGNSYRHLTAKHEGSYIELGKRKQKFTINPFDCEKNDQNLEFLSSFVHVLLGTSGYTATPQECKEIDNAVKTANRLSGLDLELVLLGRLYNWVGEGRYAYLFDNAVDTLSLSGFQAFDLQGVNQKLLEPLFFYIFNRISQIVYDPKNISRPKQLFSDECWKFLSTPSARDYFIEAGKTWRKHNGGICLITQSALDLERAGLLDCINEICPTKILLANPGANKAHYQRIFELNEREVEIFSTLTPKNQFLLKTPTKSAVLSYIPTDEEIALFSNDPNTNIRRLALTDEHGYQKGMELLGKGAAA